METKLLAQAAAKYFSGLVAVAVLLFVPAATLRFWNAWLLIVILFVPMLIVGAALLIKNPELLRKRLNAREEEAEQSGNNKTGSKHQTAEQDNGFSKQKSAETLKAGEALEEALCFGWIDGQIKSIDENTYMKYFKQRNKNNNWSEKNKKLVEALEKKGLMTDFGRAKVEYAKQHGLWDRNTIQIPWSERAFSFSHYLNSARSLKHIRFIWFEPSLHFEQGVGQGIVPYTAPPPA